MRTEFGTITTVEANHRFINLIIPEDTAYRASITAVTTACAFGNIETHSLFFRLQSPCRAYFGTRRLIAGSTNYHHKSSFRATNRPDPDAGSGHPGFTLLPGTGEHTALTTNTSICINYR